MSLFSGTPSEGGIGDEVLRCVRHGNIQVIGPLGARCPYCSLEHLIMAAVYADDMVRYCGSYRGRWAAERVSTTWRSANRTMVQTGAGHWA